MTSDAEKRNAINNFMDEELDYNGEVEVVHLLEVLRDDIGWEAVSKRVNFPLKELKVAPYYGCTLHRPTEAAIEPPHKPTALPELLQALGATAVYFPDADTCCGSYQIVGNPDIVLNRTRDILTSARINDAEVLAVSCPLCAYNLGRKQMELGEKENFQEMPVVYFTQLLALALGLDPHVCQFELNYVDPRPLLQSKGLLPLVTAAGEAS
jgi:heterodisulfide reductase subunit B